MRIKIIFETSKLPILYRHRIIALIKEALNKSDPNYKKSLYPDEGENSLIVKSLTRWQLTSPERLK